jgi:hypothetical protein
MDYSRCRGCGQPSAESGSLAKGQQGRGRLNVVVKHREQLYLDALGALIDGKVTPEYVKMRGDKLTAIRKQRRHRK